MSEESRIRKNQGEEPRLATLLSSVARPRAGDPERVQAHLDDLTKPPGSLGRLERLALRIACILGDPPPVLKPRCIFVLAGDHGVTARGVSAYPGEVTAQMCANFAAGGAAINAIGGAVDARLVIADLGVGADLTGLEGVEHRKVRQGTGDLAREPAMTRDEAVAAILAGADLVESHAGDAPVVALGEMGIGNTTAASALTAALTGRPVEDVVGPGTGVEGPRLEAKRRAVAAGLERLPDEAHPLDLLAHLGGLEIAGLAGVALAAGAAGKVVVTDGFIATAGALVAAALCPSLREYLVASHPSPEPGHRVLLEALELEPLIELELRLGEGTGAALALPLMDAAAAVLREMATFSDAGVSGPS